MCSAARVALVFLPLLSAPAEASLQGSAPHLLLEAPDGTTTRLEGSSAALDDPRERGAWIVRPRGHPAPPPPEEGLEVEIELVGGNVLRGRLLDAEGERLTFGLLGGAELTLGIDAIRRVSNVALLVRAGAPALEAPARGDLVHRWTGREVDPTPGAIEAFEPQGVRLLSETVGSKLYAWDEVATLFVEALVEPEPREGGVPVVLDLADGGRLRGDLAGLGPETCRLTIAGQVLELPWGAARELLVDDGTLRYLSALPAAEEIGRGAAFGDELGMLWPHRIDRNVLGGPLVVAGETYARGIGTHAPTRVVWGLDGSFSTLRGSVGIDDSVLLHPPEARGSVVFRVLLDGEVAWESGVVRGGDAPVAMPPVALDGHERLALEADMVGDWDARGDRADWLRVLLVR